MEINMKEEYKELEIEIIKFGCEDVITASEPEVGDDTPTEGWT